MKRLLAILLTGAVLGGCNLDPAYQRPGWTEPLNSPYGGYIFRIDFI